METAVLEILGALRSCSGLLDARALDRILRELNRVEIARLRALGVQDAGRPFSKKKLLPYYRRVKEQDAARWKSWGVDEELERRFVQTVQVKPRRTASGVATVTVITKPAKCANDCLYCPNDMRMPKSYLHDEPACQRAERCWFDPYLQVAQRIRVLEAMGHPTGKVELIVLGGSWTDYDEDYRLWFVTGLFQALNDSLDVREERMRELQEHYCSLGMANGPDACGQRVAAVQARVNSGELTYNQAHDLLYGKAADEGKRQARPAGDANGERGARPLSTCPARQGRSDDPRKPAWAQLEREHARNENAAHRVVGLVVETRPDAVTARGLASIRRLGCTKVQVGVQSMDEGLLAANGRCRTSREVRDAFALLRAFGFKIHAHFMANLLGATPEGDVADFRRFVRDEALCPDEVKLYPCALVESSRLAREYERGAWKPYPENVLVDVLARDILAAAPYTRISRVIRDFSADSIVAGNKKTNLRQMVEQRIGQLGERPREIRSREIATSDVALDELRLDEVSYCTANTRERFLQWVAPDGRIAGFLRLSLPDAEYLHAHESELPVHEGEAMIREVHVYGRAATIAGPGQNAQHRGLGRKLVERACAIAREQGYGSINVISAIGTRGYYRKLGFHDNGLYQQREL